MLADALLYGIIDLGYVCERTAPCILQQLLSGGVDIIQLRGKGRGIAELSALAKQLLPLTTVANVPLIINDYAEIAHELPVQGVHVGQEDDPVARVRARADRPIIVGKSTHNIEQAIAAEKEGADYIGFGPIFATPTKPDYTPIGVKDILQVHRRVSLPIFCIGGIKLENVGEVVAAGAKRVVIVSGMLTSDNPEEYAREAKALLNRQSKIENRKFR